MKNPGSLTDAEVLESILFLANPRKDAKKSAVSILANHRNLRSVLLKVVNEGFTSKEITNSVATVLKCFHEAFLRILRNDYSTGIALNSWDSILNYLKLKIGSRQTEVVMVFYLNSSLELLEEKEVSTGTIDAVSLYEREIIKTALNVGATSLIIAHNHFGDHVEPSKADIESTVSLVETCKRLNVDVLDHVIVSVNQHYSFKDNYLI